MNTEKSGLNADKGRAGLRRKKFGAFGISFAEMDVDQAARERNALATTRNIISLRKQWEDHIEMHGFERGRYVRHTDGWVGRIDRITPNKQIIVDGKQYSPLMFT